MRQSDVNDSHVSSGSKLKPRTPLSCGYQRNGGGGSRRQDRKMKERKTGSNSPCVINFWLQVPHSLSPKPVFPLAPGQRLLTFFALFLMSLGGDLSRAMNTRLGRKITYRKPFTGLKEKNRPIKRSYISRNHQCVQSYSPPSMLTSSIRNVWFTGGGDGRTLLLSSRLQAAELQDEPGGSCQQALPPPQASPAPQHAHREWKIWQ